MKIIHHDWKKNEIYYFEVAKNALLKWKLSTMIWNFFEIYYFEVAKNTLLDENVFEVHYSEVAKILLDENHQPCL